MELKELADRYERALEKRDFVAMANLAALCIQEMPEVSRTPFSVDHFGVCPTCGQTDGCLHVGREEWFVCHEHKAKWYVGSNLFSAWRSMTDEEFERNAELLKGYDVVESLHPLRMGRVQTCKVASAGENENEKADI